MHCLRLSGNNFAALLTLVLYLAPHCHSMPITTPGGIAENWWHNPCGPIEETTTKLPISRGGQMKSFRRTRTQLQLTHSHYKSLQLKKLYSELSLEIEKAYKYEWLPGAQLESYEEKFGRLDSNIREKAPEVLFQLHEYLQAFAVALDKLYRHVHNEEYTPFGRKRARNLQELCLELKKLLCEVEESLSAVAKEPPRPPLNSTYIPEDEWDTRQDKTTVLVQDWGILKKYGRFLQDWNTIVDKLLETNSKKRKLRGKGQNNKNRRKPNGKRKGRKGQAASSKDEQSAAANESAATVESAEGRPSGGVAKRRANKGERKNRTQRRQVQRHQRPGDVGRTVAVSG